MLRITSLFLNFTAALRVAISDFFEPGNSITTESGINIITEESLYLQVEDNTVL